MNRSLFSIKLRSMSKRIFFFLLMGLTMQGLAQAPAFFNYQGVARNSVGNVLANQPIRLRLSVHDGNATGPVLFSETRQVTTNAFGLFSIQVGGGGALSTTGSMSNINWNTGSKWLQVEIDMNGSGSLIDIGTTQLSAVPFALYANQSTDVVLPFVKTQQEEHPLFRITNTGNNANSLSIEGISSSTANNAASIRGTLSSLQPGNGAAAVIGQVNANSNNAAGVMGLHNGNGQGVYGSAIGGTGVFGISGTGTGVFGQSSTGAAIHGFLPGNATGNAGRFQNTGANNNASVLLVQSNGSGEGLSVNMTGTGKAGSFLINNTANGNNVIEATTNGSGKVALLSNTNTNNNSTVLEVANAGNGRTAIFQNSNAANNAPAVAALSNGNGDALQSIMTGTGKAAVITIANPANSNMALDVSSNGTNHALNVIQSGTGRAGFFQVNNPASTADALHAVTNGTGASWALRASSSGSNGAGLFIQSNPANTANNLQSSQAGLGRAAFFSNSNPANNSSALEVNTAGTGFAASINSSHANPKALRTAGAIQFTGLGEGANKVLATTDGTGNASWQHAASVGLVSGSGTPDLLPRWMSNGTSLGNSIIQDNGLNIGIGGPINPAFRLSLAGRMQVSANDSTGPVAVFENTSNNVNSDGIVIKLNRTHPMWNGTAYGVIPNPFTQQLDSQSNKIRDWIYGNDTFSWDDLINLMPYSYLTGSICQLTNQITEKINQGLGLPIDIASPINAGLGLPFNISGPLNNAMGLPYTIAGATVIPAIPSFGIPALPSLNIPAIPQINCANLPAIQFPVLIFDDVANSLTKENEFVAFVDKDNRKLGAIRAQSVQNFAYDYFDGQKLMEMASEFIGIDLVDDFLSIMTYLSAMVVDYNNIGVEYTSGNGDYAEWLERLDPKEEISFGDIVAVKGGKVTRNLDGAEQVMAVSRKPIVLGNMPDASKIGRGNNIAFMGQIPVKVMGPVQSGDYIVARSGIPGYGVAMHPADMTTSDYKMAVGRSWDTNLKEGPKMVNTVVGLHNNDFLHIIGQLQNKAEQTEQRLQAIEQQLQQNQKENKETQPKKGFK